jgi:rhodanese-related sulfurtransferase
MSTPSESAPEEPSDAASEPSDAASEPNDVSGEPSELEIDPEELVAWRARRPELQIVDVREGYEREAGHIEDSDHIELTELPSRAAELAQDVPIVFYCRVGSRSEMAAQAFRAAGFRAHSMRGGLVRWAQEERPLLPADGYVADH